MNGSRSWKKSKHDFENTVPDWIFHLKKEIHLNEIRANSRKIYHLPYTNKTECKLAAYSEKNESTSWKETSQNFQDRALHH